MSSFDARPARTKAGVRRRRSTVVGTKEEASLASARRLARCRWWVVADSNLQFADGGGSRRTPRGWGGSRSALLGWFRVSRRCSGRCGPRRGRVRSKRGSFRRLRGEPFRRPPDSRRFRRGRTAVPLLPWTGRVGRREGRERRRVLQRLVLSALARGARVVDGVVVSSGACVWRQALYNGSADRLVAWFAKGRGGLATVLPVRSRARRVQLPRAFFFTP